jgi:LysR family glycine cleavage system transcriptional activator
MNTPCQPYFLTTRDSSANIAAMIRLPPLNTFRFFEAAARHRNFTRAAEELHVTHGAVSQQIKALEDAAGKPLFNRKGGEMRLTTEGVELLAYVSEAFEKLYEGMHQARSSMPSRRLTLSTHPAFAARWLMPRLPEFSALHPDMEVRVWATLSPTSFKASSAVDLAIRFGTGNWLDLSVHKLMDEVLFPVCSPAFNGGVLPASNAAIAASRLLHDERFPWSLWFQAMGGQDEPVRRRGLASSDASLILQCAASGHGVALGRGVLSQDDLAVGRLVRLSEQRLPLNEGYFAVCPEPNERRPQVREFLAWLKARAQHDA